VLAIAVVAALAGQPGLLGLVGGVVAAAPLVVLGRCHHLRGRRRMLLALAPISLVLLLGAPSVSAVAIALGLGGLALAAGWVEPVEALWAIVLAGAIGLGAREPIATAQVGLGSLVALVLVRQWWAGRPALPPPEPIPPGSRLTVVVPVRDEAATIGEVVAGVPRERLRDHGLETTVLVVDDGSRDGSGAIARAAGAERVVVHATGRGLGAALRTGLREARRDGASVVVYIDGDGEYDPADLPAVAEPVLAGRADYVLGSRFPAARGVMRPARLRGNQGFTGLLRLLTGRRIADGQTGFRAFGPRALDAFEIVHDYNYAQVLTLDLLRKGMRLAEVPIRYRTRSAGRSFVRYGEYARRVLPAIARELLSP
jgi:hypothetical protein